MKSFVVLSGVVYVLCQVPICQADTLSIGSNGINAFNLTRFDGTALTGDGIRIGQVEEERPGKPNFDILHNDLVDPAFVYLRDGDANISAIMDHLSVGNHGEQVAGVMIAEHSAAGVNGVAPNAVLHASAFANASPGYSANFTPLLTTQRIATVNGNLAGSTTNDETDDVRAINMSFGLGLGAGGAPDGRQLLTSFVDWSAIKYTMCFTLLLETNWMKTGCKVGQ